MTGAADPCYATSKSLAEAWENTEACLLEKGALSRYLNLVATAALGPARRSLCLGRRRRLLAEAGS